MQAHKLREIQALEPLVVNIIDKLTAAGPSIACPWDSSVHNSYKHMLTSKYLLAANFKDNADVMPHIIREIWMLSSILPSDSLFVSVYESGSSDERTGESH